MAENDFVIKLGVDATAVASGIQSANASLDKTYAEKLKLLRLINAEERKLLTSSNGAKMAGPGESPARITQQANEQKRLNEIGGLNVNNSKQQLQLDREIVREKGKLAIAQGKFNDQQNKGSQTLNTMYKTMVAMGTVYAMRILRDAWREAISYVKEYGDALNEIRIVTGYTEEQAAKLGEKYRQIAQEMGVSSVEIAKMGATLFRQGLGSDAAVEGRMKAVITYSKIAGEDMSESANIVTVATNAFKRSGESAADAAMRVVDVWTYMGDAVETEAGEIGTSMKKVVANATVVGLSLEKISSFIATISSATRETPEIVGTSLNSVMSRYQNLTAAGMNKIFTSEEGDVVAVNNVAKALKVVGVDLYTTGLGFMSFGDVIDAVGSKWDGLGEAEKRYLGTQLAGVRAINRFYALMENYDKSLWLYEGAMDAGGTANAKYAIYLEGVTAAQDNMTNSLEGLYATFLGNDTVKDFYNDIAGVIDTFNSGVNVFGNINVKAILLVTSFGLVALAIYKIIAAIKAVEAATVGAKILGAIGGSTFKVAIAAIAGLLTITTMIAGVISEATPKVKTYEETLAELNEEITSTTARKTLLLEYATAFKELQDKQSSGTDITSEFNKTMDTLSSSTMGWGLSLKTQAGEWKSLGEMISYTNGEAGKYSDTMKAQEQEKLNAELPSQLIALSDAMKKQQAMQTLVESGDFMQWVKPGAAFATNETQPQGGSPSQAQQFYGLEQMVSPEEFQKKKDILVALKLLSGLNGEIFAVVDTFPDGSEVFGIDFNFAEALQEWWKKYGATSAALEATINAEVDKTRGVLTEAISGLLGNKFDPIGSMLSTAPSDMMTQIVKEMFVIPDNLNIIDEAGAMAYMDRIRSLALELFKGVASGDQTKLDKYYGLGTEYILKTLFPTAPKEVGNLAKYFKVDNIQDIFVKAFTNMKSLDIKGDFKTTEEYMAYLLNGSYSVMLDTINKYSDTKAVVQDEFYAALNLEKTPENQTKIDTISSTDQGISSMVKAIGLIEDGYVKFEQIGEALDASTTAEDFAAKIIAMGANISGGIIAETDNVTVLTGKADEAYANFVNKNYGETKARSDAGALYAKLSELYAIVDEYEGTGDITQEQDYTDKSLEISTLLLTMDKAAQNVLGTMYPTLMAAFGAMGVGAEGLAEALKLGMVAMIAADKEIKDADYSARIKALEDLQKAISGVSTEMSDMSSLASIQQKMDTGEPVVFDDISKLVGQHPLLSGLTGGGNKQDNQGILDTVIKEQQAEVEAAIIAMFSVSPEMMVAQGLTAETIGAYAKTQAEIYTASLWTALQEKENAENPFIAYLKTVMSQINQDTVDQMFEDTGLVGQLDIFKGLLDSGGRVAFMESINKYAKAEDGTFEAAMFDKLGGIKGFDEVVSDLTLGLIDAKEASKRLKDIVDDGIKTKAIGEYEGLATALEDIKKGGLPAAKAVQTLTKTAKDYVKAQQSSNFIQQNGGKITKKTTEAFDELASYTGYTAEEIESNMVPALDMLRVEGDSVTGMMSVLANTVQFAGSTTLDPSQWINALFAIQAPIGSDIALLQGLIRQIQAAGNMSLIATRDANGSMFFKANGANFTPLPPVKKSGGGGGSGNKNDVTKVSKDLQLYLDKMDEVATLGAFRQELVGLNKAFHEQRGEITAAMTITQQEINLLGDLNKADEAALKTLDEKIKAKQAEMAGMDIASAIYAQSTTDLKALQEQHKEYSKKLIENKTNLDALKNSLKEYKNQIRQMEIELRDLIQQAFEDRAGLEQSMLDSRVEMEDTILAVIQERYQAEWDLIKKDVDLKRKAYTEEMKLIKDKLANRKNSEEEADKYQELTDLEKQLSMIVVDPTRAKEQEELMKKITTLREELAWQAADKEVEIQTESIQQQMDSLDTYLEYINQFYEDMFANPAVMITEMNAILAGANSEMRQWLTDNYIGFTEMTAAEQEATITEMYQMSQATDEALTGWMTAHIAGFADMNAMTQQTFMDNVVGMAASSDAVVVGWMQANNDAFASSTDLKQQQMTAAWQITLMSMRGVAETYWQEIEDIITQGDDAIIAFLMANLGEYKNAGALQAAAYVDEWIKKLDNLRAAYVNVQTQLDAISAWVPPATPTYEAPSNGSGTYGGGKTYQYGYKNAGGNWKMGALGASEQIAFDNARSAAYQDYVGFANMSGPDEGAVAERIMNLLMAASIGSPGAYLKKYSKGGLVPYTGMAMVHGSSSQPEAFLSAKDTAAMRSFLDMFTRVMVPSMPNHSFKADQQQGNFQIDNITIQVEKLDSDQDYEIMAEKVAKVLHRALTVKSGSPVLARF